jgi:hypothetical protein
MAAEPLFRQASWRRPRRSSRSPPHRPADRRPRRWVDEEGTLVFRDAVYGRDEPLLRLFVG